MEIPGSEFRLLWFFYCFRLFRIHKLMKNVPPDNGSTDFYLSMAYQEEFYRAEDLKAILVAIDKEIWDKDF